MSEGGGTTFGEELRRCLNEQGFNLERLARESGVSKSTIHHWLTGKVARPYSWDNVLRVAATLNLSRSRANRLLRAGGLPSLERLAAGAGAAHAHLLAHWTRDGE